MNEGIGTPTVMHPILSGDVDEVSYGVEPNDNPYKRAMKDAISSQEVSEYIIGNTRQEGELYCDFRARLYWENLLLNNYFKGRRVWDSRLRGEARNKSRIDGTRTSKSRVKKDIYNGRINDLSVSEGMRTPDEVISRNRESKKRFLKACTK